ncbi:hypothetical protein DL98DRAFT_597846 [Cadophora sp. DSE1049]|nr:hypothetical protein DL98DRAFT_597846 [Cadophora sp. DSE1049]
MEEQLLTSSKVSLSGMPTFRASKCLKLPNIRKELNNLPKTLDATYARILNNVSSLYEREPKTVLMLLAFSARPMTIQEVAEATAVNLDIKKFIVDERFPDAYDILEFWIVEYNIGLSSVAPVLPCPR